MIKLKCIEKLRDNNDTIKAYILINEQNEIIELEPSKLKQLMRNKEIAVINLNLTSNNRLIDTDFNADSIVCFDRQCVTSMQSNKSLKFISNIKNISTIFSKAQLIGSRVKQLKDSIYAVENNDNIMIVSDKQIAFPNNSNFLFASAQFKTIDIDNVDTSNVTNMLGMFYECTSKAIRLKIDTSKVINMESMFSYCSFKELDLSCFNTSRVQNMSCMFENSKIDNLNISSFDTSKVISMQGMFDSSLLTYLDLSHFDTSKVQNMDSMFSSCIANEINISNFKSNSLLTKRNMFHVCTIDKIISGNFKIIAECGRQGLFR